MMEKLKAVLSAGETPWMGIYLRVLALFYLAGSVIHFATLLGYGVLNWEEMTLADKAATFFYGQWGAFTALGLWKRRPWGILLFFIASASQVVLYWGFPELFSSTDEHRQLLQGIINFHISTLAIFFMIRIQGR